MLKDSMSFAEMDDYCGKKEYSNCVYRGSYGICHKGDKKCIAEKKEEFIADQMKERK